ncbi:MAG: transketolase C-terminal domain-containing protein [Bdellovibrionota bacterium]
MSSKKPTGKATRQAFGEAITRLGEKYPHIVVLDADLSKSTKSEIFAKKFPERFFEMGIAEANMIGTAAGLSFTGKLPFACSFGCFLTGRYDTIRLSVGYAQANVRLVGTHAGIGIGDDGYSQMGLEDISLMRSIPTMGVFQPMDARETELILEYLVKDWKGPAYLRLTRQNLPDLFPPGKDFCPCKLMQIHSHTGEISAVCIATGATVSEAVQAAQILSGRGIGISVWNAHSLKPFDDQSLLEIASHTKLLISIEDHSVIGGLGTCVAEALAKNARDFKPVRLVKLGVQDVFAESGSATELYEKFGISAASIARRIQHELGGMA